MGIFDSWALVTKFWMGDAACLLGVHGSLYLYLSSASSEAKVGWIEIESNWKQATGWLGLRGEKPGHGWSTVGGKGWEEREGAKQTWHNEGFLSLLYDCTVPVVRPTETCVIPVYTVLSIVVRIRSYVQYYHVPYCTSIHVRNTVFMHQWERECARKAISKLSLIGALPGPREHDRGRVAAERARRHLHRAAELLRTGELPQGRGTLRKDHRSVSQMFLWIVHTSLFLHQIVAPRSAATWAPDLSWPRYSGCRGRGSGWRGRPPTWRLRWGRGSGRRTTRGGRRTSSRWESTGRGTEEEKEEDTLQGRRCENKLSLRHRNILYRAGLLTNLSVRKILTLAA